MYPSRELFEQYPDKANELHERLCLAHEVILSATDSDNLSSHTSRYGDWQITLDTSADHDLLSASSTRMGQESYSFVRQMDTWHACGRPHMFEDAQFANLVDIAVHNCLEWDSSSILSTIS